MRALLVSMHYRPEPCDTRTSVLAAELVKQGHEATVLTSFPNYPFGRIYDGYRQRAVQRETIEGVNVVRVPMFPDHSTSVKRRALSYLSFGASASVIGPLAVPRPDLVWIHHPPLTTGVAGWWLSRLKRVPFVYEVHDLWPETLTSSGMVGDSGVTRAISRACSFLYRRAAAVVVTSPGMRSHLVSQGVDEGKVFVVPQWADESAPSVVERDAAFGASNHLAGKFNVVFTGNVGAAQSLDTVLGAAQILQTERDIQFVIVGAGVELDRLRAKAARMKNVRFLGQYPKEEMPQFFAWADALVVTLKRDPLFEITVPSKLQTYLRAGRPILCGVGGDAAAVVEESGAGLTFPAGDDLALARSVRRLASMLPEMREAIGASGRNAYEAKYSVARSMESYSQIFGSILNDRPELRILGSEPTVAQEEAA